MPVRPTAALQAPREQVRVLLPALGADSVLIGAAEKAFEPMLTNPAYELAHTCRAAAAMAVRSPAAVPA